MKQSAPEYLGDAGALCFMNRLHGLNEADWLPIGTGRHQTLDYQYASDGTQIIQVEAKGAVVEQARQKTPLVSRHKSSIEGKKASPASSAATLKYGVITGIPRRVERSHCWLLDPVPEPPEHSAREIQLLARMDFLRWIIWLLAPRSQLATALQTRSRDLQLMRDPYALNGASLRQSSGETIEYRTTRYGGDYYSPFFASQSRVAGSAAGGVLIPAADTAVFVGMRSKLLQLAVEQDFDAITSYSAPTTTAKKTIDCLVPRTQLFRFGMPDLQSGSARSSPYARFELEGDLVFSQEGLVFGMLALPRNGRNRTNG
jgi:hypothetical protein